jgi:hypothetical protein
VWSAHPRLPAPELAARLLATLDDRRPTPDPARGYGSLDTYRAVTARVPAGAPNPVYREAVALLARDAPVPGGRAGAAVPAAVAAGLVLVLISRAAGRRRNRVSGAPGRAPLGSAH